MKLLKITYILVTLFFTQIYFSFAYSQEKTTYYKSEVCSSNSNKDAFVDCKTTDGNFNVIINYKTNIITINEYDVYKIISHTKSSQQTTIKAIQNTGIPYSVIVNMKEGWVTFTDEASFKRVKLYNAN